MNITLNPYIGKLTFDNMSSNEKREWLQNMQDRGANQSDIAELLGVHQTTVSKNMIRLGVHARGRGKPKDWEHTSMTDGWTSYLNSYDEPHETYEPTDADFEYLQTDLKPITVKPIKGTMEFFGTPAQVAEAWWKLVGEGKMRVTITWEP